MKAETDNSKVLMGTSAMALASVIRIVIQVAIFPILGRLIGPDAYGEIALVSPFIFFAMLLAESGLGACIVRASSLSEKLQHTVFCFSFAFSTFVILLFCLIAVPLGHLLKDENFPRLLIAMSTILWLAALNIVPASILLRSKRYDLIALSDFASSLGGIAALLTGVALHWGVWCLVAQQMMLWVAKVSVVLIGSKYIPRFQFSFNELKEHFSYGSNIVASGILSFVAKNLDNLLIGTFMGSQVLGFYAIAFQIVSVPQMVFGASVYFTLFSSISEKSRNGSFSSAAFLKTFRYVLLLAMPSVVGLASMAKLLTLTVLGEQWIPASKLIMFLCPMGLAQAVGVTTAAALLGLGRADLSFRYSLISSTVTVLGIFLTAITKNSASVAIAVGLSALVYPILSFRYLILSHSMKFVQIVSAISSPIIASLVMGFGIVCSHGVMKNYLGTTQEFVVTVISGILIYALTLVVISKKQTINDLLEIRNAVFRQNKNAIQSVSEEGI